MANCMTEMHSWRIMGCDMVTTCGTLVRRELTLLYPLCKHGCIISVQREKIRQCMHCFASFGCKNGRRTFAGSQCCWSMFFAHCLCAWPFWKNMHIFLWMRISTTMRTARLWMTLRCCGHRATWQPLRLREVLLGAYCESFGLIGSATKILLYSLPQNMSWIGRWHWLFWQSTCKSFICCDTARPREVKKNVRVLRSICFFIFRHGRRHVATPRPPLVTGCSNLCMFTQTYHCEFNVCMFLLVRGITIRKTHMTIRYSWLSSPNSFVPFLSVKTIAVFVRLSDAQASPCRIGLMTRAGPLGEAGGMLQVGMAIRKVGAAEIHGKLPEIHGKLEALPWFHAALTLQQRSGWPPPRCPKPKRSPPSHLNKLHHSKMKTPRLRVPLRCPWPSVLRPAWCHLVIRHLLCCADQKRRATRIHLASWCEHCYYVWLMRWASTQCHCITKFRTHQMHLGMTICLLYHLLLKRLSSPVVAWQSLVHVPFLKSRTQTRWSHVWILWQ